MVLDNYFFQPGFRTKNTFFWEKSQTSPIKGDVTLVYGYQTSNRIILDLDPSIKCTTLTGTHPYY